MFDAPVDAVYAWLGVAVASVAVLGVVTALPTAPPPDATGAAAVVDRIATTEYGASATRRLHAEAVAVGPERIGLRNDAGTTHARFAYGPVVPVARGTELWRVLLGAAPDAVFDRGAFRQSVEMARSRERRWHRVDGPMRVRHLVREGIDVTLVGA